MELPRRGEELVLRKRPRKPGGSYELLTGLSKDTLSPVEATEATERPASDAIPVDTDICIYRERKPAGVLAAWGVCVRGGHHLSSRTLN
jgi:hypothetical protein